MREPFFPLETPTSEDADQLRVLLALSGLGLGNATRQHALLEELASRLAAEKRRLDLVVCGWGRAAAYFRDRPGIRLVELAPYPGSPLVFLRNSYRIFREVLRHRPQIILLDSDYHWPAYFFLRSRVVYVGQAWNVVFAAIRERPRWPARTWLRFLFLELGDALYQTIFSRLVLAPGFVEETKETALCARIPLLVRSAYRSSHPEEAETAPEEWIVSLSGSGLESHALRELADSRGYPLLGPKAEGDPVCTERPRLDGYAGVITQCGLSSLSEAVARRKPMALVPMANHPEQHMNALTVARLRWGAIVGTRPAPEELARVRARGPLPLDRTRSMTSGAAAAVNLLLRRR